MQATLVYALSVASLIGLVLVSRLAQLLTFQARERLFSVCSKWIIYTLAWSRPRGSSDVSVLAAVTVILFFVGNVIGSVLAVRGRAELSLRLARLCIMNLVILFLGGRTNFILDKVFQLSMGEYYSMHRWIGRISLAEGILHGILGIVQARSTVRNIELSLFIVFGSIAFCSFLFVRRRIYEIFLGAHLPAAVALIVLLFLHLREKSTYVIYGLSISAGMLLLQKILWFLSLLYRNIGSGPPCRASVVRFPQCQGDGEVLQLQVKLKRPWNIKPGQFVYLSLPRLRSLGLSILESHPFMVAWSYEDKDKATTTIVLLVRCCRGFTNKLRLTSGSIRAIVDGPYGINRLKSLGRYDKLLFLADGIGIAAHLLPIRQLLLAHDEQTARVRRLSLVWLLETKDQLCWAEEFLFALHDMDHRQILTIFLLFPHEIEGSSYNRVFSIKQPRKRIYPLTCALDMDWWIEQEWCAEAGNMLITVCGSPQFEMRVRKAIRSSRRNISFSNTDFQPDETPLSSIRSSMEVTNK